MKNSLMVSTSPVMRVTRRPTGWRVERKARDWLGVVPEEVHPEGPS